MKKTMLLLGSLLAVASIAQAKEVMPAPVIQEETKVVEVIVYKEAQQAWKPNGNADLSYTFYGEDEYDSQEYGRLQFQGNLNFTEKQSIDWRVREYRAFQNGDKKYDAEGRRISDYGDFSDMRFRYNYKYGQLGNSRVGLTHRLEYRTYTGVNGADLALVDDQQVNMLKQKNSQYLDYTARFEFKDYVSQWTPEWFKNTTFVLAPRYRYGWANNDSNYYNRAGLNFYSFYDLPWGFTFEFNLYGYYQNYGQDQKLYNNSGKYVGETTDELWALDMEAYLYWTYPLYAADNWELSFNFEGGYDPYSFRTENNTGGSSKNTYELYMEPNLRVDYQATEHVTVYGMIHAKYFNWEYQNQANARDWTWQPRATLGFKTDF